MVSCEKKFESTNIIRFDAFFPYIPSLLFLFIILVYLSVLFQRLLVSISPISILLMFSSGSLADFLLQFLPKCLFFPFLNRKPNQTFFHSLIKISIFIEVSRCRARCLSITDRRFFFLQLANLEYIIHYFNFQFEGLPSFSRSFAMRVVSKCNRYVILFASNRKQKSYLFFSTFLLAQAESRGCVIQVQQTNYFLLLVRSFTRLFFFSAPISLPAGPIFSCFSFICELFLDHPSPPQ